MDMESVRNKMEHLKMNSSMDLLSEFVDDAKRSSSSHLEFFNKILEYEVDSREERRIATSLKISNLPKGMYLDNYDYLFQPSIEKTQIENLSNCDFIRDKTNVLFFGPPGVGKTHLASALGIKAIHLGYSVIYYTAEELLYQLRKRIEIPVMKQKGRAYVKNALVIVDELGYQSLDRHDTHLFFQFISARYMKGSTIITSNRSVKEWVNIFSEDQMATTAILDRLFHRAHIINIDGRSYRLKDFDTKIRGEKSSDS